MDYRHHWQDVLVGGLLGFFIAYFSYRLYYPPLQAKFSHRPHGPRTPEPLANEGPLLPVHSQLSSLNGSAMLRGVQAENPHVASSSLEIPSTGTQGHEANKARSQETLDSLEATPIQVIPRVWQDVALHKETDRPEEAGSA
jgi:hypothetical protein